MCKTYVYYSVIPEGIGDKHLYPEGRMSEINGCKSDKARREKYWAWILLEHALKDSFNLDIDNLRFAKNDNGKWESDKAFFSVSHSDKLVAVAVSDSAVGVDIEREAELRAGVETKILTDGEMSEYNELPSAMRALYVIKKWCQKEAIFKRGNQKAFLPRTVEAKSYKTEVFDLAIDGEKYTLAVASDAENILKEICIEQQKRG